MINLDEQKLHAAIVERAADELIDADQIGSLVTDEVNRRLDVIFKDRAEAAVAQAVDDAVKNGFEREYQRVNNWGEREGEKTTIKKELERMVSSYWAERVDKNTGKPTESPHSSVSRAEYLMAQICAEDFSEAMKKHANNVTGALKDGLRNQLATHMDQMLNSLFRIKSLQDQGKVEKPW